MLNIISQLIAVLIPLLNEAVKAIMKSKSVSDMNKKKIIESIEFLMKSNNSMVDIKNQTEKAIDEITRRV